MRNDGLHVVRAVRSEALASELAAALVRPVADPFAQPLVLVGSAAVQRWLSQRVAEAGGVCAGIEFAPPGALAARLGGDDDGEDPWAPESLVWSVLELASADVPGLEPLRANLDRSEQRYANALRVARLFGRYAHHRPDLLAGWSAQGDPAAWALGFDAWQGVLWR